MGTTLDICQRYHLLWASLDERGSRLFAATEAKVIGYGGISALSKITGLPRRRPIRMKMMCVKGFRQEEIMRLGAIILTPGSDVVTDGLSCFQCLADCGCLHTPIKTSGNKEVQNSTFKWVDTVLGNVKKFITGIYQAVHKHSHSYLASFSYRFNRRFDLSTMLTRLAYVALRTEPMPFRLLKLGLS